MTHQMGSEAPLTLEQYERCHILEVLRETNWRIEGSKGAALIFGLHPNTLRSRMQKLVFDDRLQMRRSLLNRYSG